LDDEQTPFHYLVDTWKRAAEMSRTIRQDRDPQAGEKLKILAEIRRLSVSYAGLSLMMPDMFGDAPREADICGYLLQDMYSDVKIPEDFLQELAKRFHEDGLVDVIGSTIQHLGEEIASNKFNGNYQSAMRAMVLLAQIKPIASIMPDLSNWIPAPTTPPSGAVIEEESLLGQLFGLSPLARGVSKSFFRDPKNMSRGDKISMTNSIQDAVRQYQSYLFQICNFIIKSGTRGRRGVLDWFSAVLAQNEKRKALQVDPATVASDGFMCNVVAVLNKFAEPFVDIQGKKVHHDPH
jgi:ubiquitin conjugation factor E4 B